jgi:16S rRNA processing protein RimM
LSNSNETFVKFAKIKKPHGVGGNVKVAFLPGGFFDLSKTPTLIFLIGENFIEYEIDNIKGETENPIVHFKNIINKSDAKFLQAMDVYIKRSTLRSLGEKLNIEYIDAAVFVREGKKEIKIGRVFNIAYGQHYDYLEIMTLKGNELMIPFVDNDFIIEKSIDDKKIVATNQTGIFNEEL